MTSRNFRDSTGTVAIEFAILCPFYLVLVMGMTAYGIYFGASHSVQQISSDIARAAIAGVDERERKTLVQGFVSSHADGYLFIDPEKLTIQAADSATGDTQFEVIVSYEAEDLPIWGLLDGIALPGQTIVRRSTIRIGGI